MKLRLLSSLSFFALALQIAGAQPADDFFHQGAQSYLTNNIPNALTQTESGLKLYPDDVKLKKLDELLKQQQQQQSQQNQQEQNQQSQDQQKKDQEQQQQKQNEQQKQQNQKPDQEKQQQPEEQQAKPGEMTPQQAKQLLDSEKGDEKLLPVSRAEKPRDRSKPLKDW